MYDLNKYVNDCLRSESKIEHVQVDAHLLVAAMQISIAAGSILDQIKKNVFYKRDYNEQQLAQEFANIVKGVDSLVLSLSKKEPSEEVVLEIDPRIFHAVVGIATEATELLQAINSDSGKLDTVNLLEEWADCCWYGSILTDAVGGDWGKALDTNIEKLRKRYPEKFTSDNAINRDLDGERQILENQLK